MSEHKQLPFFVYGTLLPDQPNFVLFGEAITGMEPAIFQGGQLYDMGYYPMLVRDEAGTAVSGQLISVNPSEYEAVVQQLDVLEGYDPADLDNSEYHRLVVEVMVANGRTQTAWVYLGQARFVTDKPIIPDGDWAAHVAQNQPKLQEWWQDIDTVAGLHK